MSRNKKRDPILDIPDEHIFSNRVHLEEVDKCPFRGFSRRKPRYTWELDYEMPLCCRYLAHGLQKIVSEVARVLNQAGIACVLWDKSPFDVYGLGGGRVEPTFVIADRHIQKAADVLCKASFAFGAVTRCAIPDGETCSWASGPATPSESKYTLPHHGPYTHLHTPEGLFGMESRGICLYKQSLTLWAMPPLSDLPVPATGSQENLGGLALALGPDWTIASHPRFREFRTARQVLEFEPYGRFPADLHPVVLPAAERTMEALLRLYGRYSGSGPFSRCKSWEAHVEDLIVSILTAVKVGAVKHFDTRRISPGVRLLVVIALGGNISMGELRRALREVLGEFPNPDRFPYDLFNTDDDRFSDFPAWELIRANPDWPYASDRNETEEPLPAKKERKYWLQVQKKE